MISKLLKLLANFPRSVKAVILLCIDAFFLGFTMLLAFAVRFDPDTIEYQYQNQQMEQNQYYQQNNQNQWTEEQIQAYQQQHNQYYGGGQQ